MNALACPANFTPNSTSTPSGASAMFRKMLATATAAGLIAPNVASKLLATVSTTSEGCSPRVTAGPASSSTSSRTLPPPSSGKEMRRFTDEHLKIHFGTARNLAGDRTMQCEPDHTGG